MNKLGFVGIAVAVLAVSGCGGGTSTTPATSTATPAPSATPGTLSVAYSDTFGVTGTAPTALGFLAETETATLTATQANYSGSFTAASSCAAVTVTPATSTTGAFTATAVSPAATGCTITVTGATGTTAATLAATVPTPGGVVLRWYLPNYITQSPPVPQSASPINLAGTGSLFASILAVTEQSYVGGLASVAASGGCTGFATVAANTTTPTGLPTAAPGNTLTYYTVTGTNAVSTTGGCNVTATDNQSTPSAASIAVEITTTTGVFQ